MTLNNFDQKDFLENYWQKKPMVIRNAFEDVAWIEPDELAGLACEAEVESRIILQQDDDWKVEHGPFPEKRFSTLPKTHWTLLVQGVDQWLPDVAGILKSFGFLPAWRLDDIMVSYAPVGGTVSQHYDFFDVFLIQGEGSRTWQIGDICGSHSDYIPDIPVRILKDFQAKMEVTLQSGDILYIPAKYSHYGVSVEDSVTYSVGFRAPSIRDVVDGVSTAALEHLLEDERFEDSLLSLGAERAEISVDAINHVKAMLLKAMSDESLIRSWLGQYVTERKYPEHEIVSGEVDNYLERLQEGESLIKDPSARFAYFIRDHVKKADVVTDEGKAILFADGEEYLSSVALAKYISNQYELDSDILMKLLSSEQDKKVVESLILTGALVFEDDFLEDE
jgi:50S ribosomal protein L16 3-hydroxylase